MQNPSVLYKKPLFNTLPLYLLALLFTVPFLLRIRIQPITSYILDNISFVLALVIVLVCGIQGRLWHKVPKVTWYFLALAAFWLLQTFLIDLPFVGQSYFAIGIFLGMAVFSFALRGLLLAFGREKIILFIAVALLVGSLLQFGVGVIQLLNLESYFNGFILRSANATTIFGQLGQRNHYGHYLMWGLVATCYLHSIDKLRLLFSILIVLALSVGLALTGSRTVILYGIIVLVITVIWPLRMRNFASNRLLKISLFALITLLLFQWVIPYLLTFFGINLDSGMERLVTSSGGRRSFEWLKAWLVFKEHPLFGVGWSGYAPAAYALDTLPAFINEPKETGLFVHSHNLVTQLLAEVGLVGTLLTLLGFVWVIWRYFSEKATLENWMLLCLMGVSLGHSMLEYPLWYIYFLAPFAVFMSLSIPTEKEETVKKCWLNGGLIFLVTSCLFGYSIHLMSVYNQLQGHYFLRNMDHAKEIRIKELERLAKEEPLFRFYTLYTLESFYASTVEGKRSKEVNQQVTDFRPYSYPVLRKVMYQDLAGEKKQAQETLIHMNTYYQIMTPEFLSMLGQSGKHPDLIPQTLKACQELQKKRPKAKCVAPKKITGSEENSD